MKIISAGRVKALRDHTAAGVMDCKRALVETGDDLEAAAELLQQRRLLPSKLERPAAAEGLIAYAGDAHRAVLIELTSETDFVSRNAEFRAAASVIARAALGADGDVSRTMAAPAPDGRGDTNAFIERLALKFGEPVRLKRVVALSTQEGVLGAYVHNSPAPGIGRMASLVALSGVNGTEAPDLARKLAVHVVGAAPLWPSVYDVPASVREQKQLMPDAAKRDGSAASQMASSVASRLQRFYAETVLLRQPFILAPDRTVEEAIVQAGGPAARVEGFVCLRVGEDPEHDRRVAAAAELEWTFGNGWADEEPAELSAIGDTRIFVVSPSGPKLRDDRDVVDLINSAWSKGAGFIALPVERLGHDFFPLSTRKAGAIFQKFSNLGGRIAIVGDISREVSQSTALRDFVYESNRRGQVLFVGSVGELEASLARVSHRASAPRTAKERER